MKRLLALMSVSAATMFAAPSDSLLGITLVQNKTGSALSVPMQILLLMTALTLLPAILMAVTPFLRVVVVLHFLRQALGTQTAPSNQVLLALALFIALVVMQPVAIAGLSPGMGTAGERANQRVRSMGPGRGADQRLPAEIRA